MVFLAGMSRFRPPRSAYLPPPPSAFATVSPAVKNGFLVVVNQIRHVRVYWRGSLQGKVIVQCNKETPWR
jgi:hypothetical protein